MITDFTPPFLTPPPEPHWLAYTMPQSGREGAGWLVATIGLAMMLWAAVGVITWLNDRRRLKAIWQSADTPETDEAVGLWAVDRDTTHIIECSRRLERLRVATIKSLEDHMDSGARLAKQRDDANKAAEEMRIGRMECARQLEEAHAEIARLRRAREE